VQDLFVSLGSLFSLFVSPEGVEVRSPAGPGVNHDVPIAQHGSREDGVTDPYLRSDSKILLGDSDGVAGTPERLLIGTELAAPRRPQLPDLVHVEAWLAAPLSERAISTVTRAVRFGALPHPNRGRTGGVGILPDLVAMGQGDLLTPLLDQRASLIHDH